MNVGGKTIGFNSNKLAAASKINKGDRLICYVTKISKFVGILEVEGGLLIQMKKGIRIHTSVLKSTKDLYS